MRTRTHKGHYTGHRSPGDGTGFDHMPTAQPKGVLTDVDPKAQHLPPSRDPVMRKSHPRKS